VTKRNEIVSSRKFTAEHAENAEIFFETLRPLRLCGEFAIVLQCDRNGLCNQPLATIALTHYLTKKLIAWIAPATETVRQNFRVLLSRLSFVREARFFCGANCQFALRIEEEKM
jgi:hypothetical protein